MAREKPNWITRVRRRETYRVDEAFVKAAPRCDGAGWRVCLTHQLLLVSGKDEAAHFAPKGHLLGRHLVGWLCETHGLEEPEKRSIWTTVTNP